MYHIFEGYIKTRDFYKKLELKDSWLNSLENITYRITIILLLLVVQRFAHFFLNNGLNNVAYNFCIFFSISSRFLMTCQIKYSPIMLRSGRFSIFSLISFKFCMYFNNTTLLTYY